MAKKKELSKEDLEIEKLIEQLEKSSHLGPIPPGQKELIRRMEKEKRRKEEEARKSFIPGKLSPQDEARIEDMERRYKHRIYDFKYGTFNPKLFVIRFFQFFAVLWIIGYILQERDRVRAQRRLDEEIERRRNYYQYDPTRPIQDIAEHPKGGGKVIYHDMSKKYDVTQDFFYNGIPGSKKKSGKNKVEVTIRPVGHGKFDEYTIETKGSPGLSPENLLEQIDDEDILDYMDGGMD